MRRIFMSLVVIGALGMGPGESAADPYDPQEAGHPLRALAYVLHPAGVILDLLIFRPVHWVVHRHDAVETLFGHTD